MGEVFLGKVNCQRDAIGCLLMIASQLQIHPSCLLAENGSGPFKFVSLLAGKLSFASRGRWGDPQQERLCFLVSMCSQSGSCSSCSPSSAQQCTVVVSSTQRPAAPPAPLLGLLVVGCLW